MVKEKGKREKGKERGLPEHQCQLHLSGRTPVPHRGKTCATHLISTNAKTRIAPENVYAVFLDAIRVTRRVNTRSRESAATTEITFFGKFSTNGFTAVGD